jgi:magnesium-transporting ATPase (P-type)
MTSTDPSLFEPSEIAAQLGVAPASGLANDEAARRLEADGPNELRGRKPIPGWRRLLSQFNDPLVYLLLVAVTVSVVAWFGEGAESLPIDAIVIAAIVIANAVIGFVQESRAVDAVRALKAMTAATSTVLRDGAFVALPSSQLVRGDVLVLGEGDAVGADARLIASSGLRVAEASLTGESEPASKDPRTLTVPTSLGDRTDMVFKGTAVVQGSARAIVTGTGMATEMGRIAGLLDATVEEPTPLQVEVGRIGRTLGIAVTVIALVVMVTIGLVNGIDSLGDLVVILLLGVSLAVAAVPEGLPAILSLVLAIGVQRLARRNAIVKKLDSVETLGSASVICSDKTGTLTRNEMTIERIRTHGGELSVTGSGYRPEGAVTRDGRGLTDDERFEAQLVLGAGSIAGNARLSELDGEWMVHGDPTEAAFLVAAGKLDGTREHIARWERQAEFPFDSQRKMMSTLNRERDDGTVLVFTKGAPDVLLAHCTRLQVGRDSVPLTEEARARAHRDIDHLSSEAYRTLGVAYRPLGDTDGDDPEHDLVYVGVVGIIDPPRVEVAAAITEAQRAGIRVIMITGDHPGTATRIATDLGIVGRGARVLTGTQLSELSGAELAAAVREVSVYARVDPEHKLRLVDALQAEGQIVAMTGDGVNDAPALKSADIGIAMGITGTEVTKQAARMILADDDFATIVAAVRQGRVIFDNIRKFLRYLLSSNMGEVLTVFLGVVFAGFLGLTGASGEAIALPLLATQILWINLVTDSGPALAMGVDPEVDDVMARAPRAPGERAIGGAMWAGIVAVGFVMALLTLFAIDLWLPGGLVDGHDSIEVARTAGFTTLVFAQLFNALNARSGTVTAFRGITANRWLWGAILLAIVLQIAVVHVPALQVAFGTAGLDLVQWGVCIALASVVLWYEEVRKALAHLLRRARSSRNAGPRGTMTA